MNALTLALTGAIAYGSADFLGGLASRKNAAATVVVVSQAIGAIVLPIGLAISPERFPAGDALLGAAAGVAGAIGIGALYAALAAGRMGVVSPISAAIGASVPVIAGIAGGERPAPFAVAGVILAFAAVALVSANGDLRGFSLREPGLGAALVSGVAIGVLYVLLARGRADGGLALLGFARATSVPLLALYAILRRQTLRPAPGTLGTMALAGLLDMSANVLYVFATHVGLLSIVAVVTSLYPVSTVLLARLVLDERLQRMQWVGAGCALAGVLLIAL